MSECRIFWVRLYLTVVATVSTAIAAGAVTFELLGSRVNHDVGSFATLVALACNTALTGMATMRSPRPPTT